MYVIAREFNIDWYRDYYRTRLVIRNENDLKQIVNEFNRITQSSKTLIDYIIKIRRILELMWIITYKIMSRLIY